MHEFSLVFSNSDGKSSLRIFLARTLKDMTQRDNFQSRAHIQPLRLSPRTFDLLRSTMRCDCSRH